jgi:hypothetical protein
MTMRKLVLALATSTAVLGGCATTPTVPNTATIQTLAVQICGFLPTAIQIFNLVVPGLLTSDPATIATAICAAVAPVPTPALKRLRKLGVGAPVNVQVQVGGEVFHVSGYFVR